MTEPKTQTERATDEMAIREKRQTADTKHPFDCPCEKCVWYSSGWNANASEVEAATRGLREQLKEAESVIRHYGDDVNWNVRKITSDHPCEYCGYDREIYEYDGPTDNGTKLAQEYLKKHGGE
jgi:hypothetical protein